MIRPEVWPVAEQKWDGHRAFHVNCARNGFNGNGYNAPLTLFDTGELICQAPHPDPDVRGAYHSVGVSLAKSDEWLSKLGELYSPAGVQLKDAWFTDKIYLLIDHDTNRAVRLDGTYHSRAQAHASGIGKEVKHRQGIPERFQHVRAYIGGPGQYPVGNDPITIHPLLRSYVPAEENERIMEMGAILKAYGTLADDPRLRTKLAGYPNLGLLRRAKRWEELDEQTLNQAFHNGVKRVSVVTHYLLTQPPAAK